MKGKQKTIIAGLLLVLLLAAAFWYGGSTPDSHGWGNPSQTAQQSQPANPVTEPLETTAAEEKPEGPTCTISISCAALLEHLDWCDPAKVELVPEDGWILKPITVALEPGDSVFDVLQRVCREQNIHMEYSDTPMYDSAYLEGIHNLYEFDAGEQSGWMYAVNDWFPNYGCSQYELQDGDVIRWVYTCNLGEDVKG